MDALSLADFRARVAAMYLSDVDVAGFRALRDELFATHPSRPRPGRCGISPSIRRFRAVVPVEPADGSLEIATGGEDGVLRYERVGVLRTPWGRLTLFWLAAYGGGLFLPFRDAHLRQGVLRRGPLPDGHRQGHPRPRRRAGAGRPGAAGLQLRLQPQLRL